MRFCGILVALIATFGIGTLAQAQDRAWIQIEARPTLDEAVTRAQAYSTLFPDVVGYTTPTGWYAVVLGPYLPAEAAGRLSALRDEAMIPRDSFISDGTSFGQPFWPADATAVIATEPQPLLTEPAPQTADETPEAARASEALLMPDDRKALQMALNWYGYYQGGMDGAFGKGTRKSMAAWQEVNGFEPSGILTTHQRAILIANYNTDQMELGFQTITETESGIEMTLPMALVEFDSYEPPFVRFQEKSGSGVQIMLLSEPGGAEALAGLYDVLQSLQAVPPTGDRWRDDNSFTINARNDKVASFAYAETAHGMVKGYLVIWRPEDTDRMDRILPALSASFHPIGDKALDPGMVPIEDAVRTGLLAGLEVRRPKLSRSGFFVTRDGQVVTSVEAVAKCTRVTINHDTEAEVRLTDPASGIALLRPMAPLAPPFVAGITATGWPEAGGNLVVAGYSYEDKLPAPVLTYGTYDEEGGLGGETGIARISAPVLPGDAGGPVLDASGAVVGMLLSGGGPVDKTLPQGVAFAATASTLLSLLTAQGITVEPAPQTEQPTTPDALNTAGLGMTVLVSCWE